MQGKLREKGIYGCNIHLGMEFCTSEEAINFPQDHIFCPHFNILLLFSLMLLAQICLVLSKIVLLATFCTSEIEEIGLL